MSIEIENCAAIVCEHIAHQRCPILSAFKTESVVPEDSGWQFFCGTLNEEGPQNAQIWLLREVYLFEPTLRDFADVAAGTQIWRDNPQTDWVLRQIPEGE